MKKLLFSITLLTFSSSLLAAQPQHCPSVSQIKQVGISNNPLQDNNGRWYTGKINQMYGTPEHWSFVIGGIKARSKNIAIFKAKLAMRSLRYSIGPVQQFNKYICLYSNNLQYTSGAITPPLNSLGVNNLY